MAQKLGEVPNHISMQRKILACDSTMMARDLQLLLCCQLRFTLICIISQVKSCTQWISKKVDFTDVSVEMRKCQIYPVTSLDWLFWDKTCTKLGKKTRYFAQLQGSLSECRSFVSWCWQPMFWEDIDTLKAVCLSTYTSRFQIYDPSDSPHLWTCKCQL